MIMPSLSPVSTSIDFFFFQFTAHNNILMTSSRLRSVFSRKYVSTCVCVGLSLLRSKGNRVSLSLVLVLILGRPFSLSSATCFLTWSLSPLPLVSCRQNRKTKGATTLLVGFLRNGRRNFRGEANATMMMLSFLQYFMDSDEKKE